MQPHSEEQKRKISERMKQVWSNPEHRKLVHERQVQCWQDEGRRARRKKKYDIDPDKPRKPVSEETNKPRKPVSEETKQKHRETLARKFGDRKAVIESFKSKMKEIKKTFPPDQWRTELQKLPILPEGKSATLWSPSRFTELYTRYANIQYDNGFNPMFRGRYHSYSKESWEPLSLETFSDWNEFLDIVHQVAKMAASYNSKNTILQCPEAMRERMVDANIQYTEDKILNQWWKMYIPNQPALPWILENARMERSNLPSQVAARKHLDL